MGLKLKKEESEYSEYSEYQVLFERGASEGCLASVAAKLVKTAVEIPFCIHARGNKSGRQIWDNFGTFWYENFF